MCLSGPAKVIHYGKELFVIVICWEYDKSPEINVKQFKDFGSFGGFCGKWESVLSGHGTYGTHKRLFGRKLRRDRRYALHFNKRNMSQPIMPQQVYIIFTR